MRTHLACFLFCAVFGLASPAWPLDIPAGREIGIRGGIDATGLEENYAAQEIYFLYDLPWASPIKALPGLHFRLDAGLGHVRSGSDSGVWLAVGGDLFYRVFGDRLIFEAGWRPTWLPDYRFGDDHMGGPVQFSSHAGLALQWKKAVLGYRFQHTSNAGLYTENPGLDLHLFSLGVRF